MQLYPNNVHSASDHILYERVPERNGDETSSRKQMDSSEDIRNPHGVNKLYKDFLQQTSRSISELKEKRGISGLCNLGNSCYMNASIQSLSNCSPLTKYFLKCFVSSSDSTINTKGAEIPHKRKLSDTYADLLTRMWSGQFDNIAPHDFIRVFCEANPFFLGFAQQDSQEFLRCLLNRLSEELKQEIPSQFSSDLKMNSASPRESNSFSRSFFEITNNTYKDHSHTAANTKRDGDDARIICTEDICLKETQGESGSAYPLHSDLDGNLLRSRTGIGNGLEYDENQLETTQHSEHTTNEQPMNRIDSFRPVQCKRSESPKKTVLPNSTLKSYRNIIADIFEGTLLSRVVCLQCNKESITRDRFYDLSISIPESIKDISQPQITREEHSWWSYFGTFLGFSRRRVLLSECVRVFCTEEPLIGKDQYHCEHCNSKNDGKKIIVLERLPEILCIHLKRFRCDSYFSNKISDHVVFPLHGFDLGPFCSSSYLSIHSNPISTSLSFKTATINSNSNSPNTPSMPFYRNTDSEMGIEDSVFPPSTIYDLIAVISHRGGLYGGHYIAYCRNFLDKCWYEFNDQSVTKVDEAYVENVEAYVVFYEKRKSLERENEIMQVKKLLKQKTEEEEEMAFVSKEWYLKWKSFADPGALYDNQIFICKHQCIKPEYLSSMQLQQRFFRAIPKSVWSYFLDCYSKDYRNMPCIQRLIKCEVCEQENTLIDLRREYEKKRNSS